MILCMTRSRLRVAARSTHVNKQNGKTSTVTVIVIEYTVIVQLKYASYDVNP